ncbi:histidinol-phosphate transaminase [Aquimarina sp. 2201CG1-2-11]|uniref:pyridoxal phosphate-dependent aminotransferase n=1 Tax=Aquimarina discodermiae TaxID=3231043 RepID=UPI0034632FBE
MFRNKSINNLKPYKVTSHKAWEHKEDKDVLKLDWNEATILPSPLVEKRLQDVITNGRLNWYPDTNNTDLLNKISKYNNVDVSNVQYFASSDVLHEYIVRCFIGESDRVLIIGPTYDNFRAVAESNGAQIQNYYLDSNFELDYRKFNEDLKLIRPKVVYIVNPNNPTGTLHPKEELINLIQQNTDTFFIVDEAYYEFSGITLSQDVEKYKNVLISRTFSKAFALASFRIGYTISHENNIEILNSIRNPKNVSLFAQEAALAALSDIEYTKSYVDDVLDTKTNFSRALQKFEWIDTVYEGTGNFVFFSFKEAIKKKELLSYFNKNKIFIRDYGHIDLTSKFVRITVGKSIEMSKVLKVLNTFNNEFVGSEYKQD